MGWGAGLATERGGGAKGQAFFALAVSRRTRGLDKASNGNLWACLPHNQHFSKKEEEGERKIIDANLEAHTIIFF